jgi:hypothetical protein
MPSSIGLMNSFGIDPAVDLVLEDVAGARLAGIQVNLACPYCPRPPGLLAYLLFAVGGRVSVSL